ncbi:FAD-dependent oxidoreductase [Mycolicibacterium madagascariense]|uniref:FAD-dependent oxidoreductase n=1 Tax=Mycolicibacterium madagascariense TaxID=212765 RepID=A0A7I7X967_9MYCO|nr:FAD-dependent monooxygenase [Mycolicibacterium madagascariense]MCV7014196.1 FAD-dependent monooxygenase [Mycolicibacterium madagascariense]BBZ25805.1 FAD-dependent oxidoreductase [Mycolicibacterium madagascariense]
MLYDVIIAGAGPVGLFLAAELRLADCSVLVLERAPDPRSPHKRLPFGLRGLTVPATDALYRRGLLAAITGSGDDDGGADSQGGSSGALAQRHPGHFAGIPLRDDKIDLSRWPYHLPSPTETNMAAEMEHIETVLAQRATSLGAHVQRGHGVDEFTQTKDEVIVRTGTQSVRGRWLVGCDGGRSTVRKVGHFPFIGTDPQFTGYMAQVDIADPDKLNPGRTLTPTGLYEQSEPGFLAMLEFDGGAFHRTAPVTLDHVQAVLRRVSGTDTTLTALHLAATWTDRAQQATTYRDGRILLAGDAAHIHSPLGAQGLNTGLGDAMNLGWKLAATIRGEAPEDLLDTYTIERHPIAAHVLDWSRAQTAIMAPTPQARAINAIVRDLIDTTDGATYFAERLWSASQRYDIPGDHPLIGRSAPDFELPDGTRLAALLHDGRGLLLDFDAAAPLQAIPGADFRGRIDYLCTEVKDRLGLAAVLVRPDGVVAWACDDRPDPTQAAHAAARWFTPPTDPQGRR